VSYIHDNAGPAIMPLAIHIGIRNSMLEDRIEKITPHINGRNPKRVRAFTIKKRLKSRSRSSH